MDKSVHLYFTLINKFLLIYEAADRYKMADSILTITMAIIILLSYVQEIIWTHYRLFIPCYSCGVSRCQLEPTWRHAYGYSFYNLGQQIMYSSASFYRAIDTPISYFIVFSGISTTRSAGVGIVGFQTVIGYDYAVNTTV